MSTQGGAVAALFFVSLLPIVSLQVVGVRAAIGWFLACLLLLIGLALKWFTGIVIPIEHDPALMSPSPIRAVIIFLISVSVTLVISDIACKAAERREILAEDERIKLDRALVEESARHRALVENSRDVVIELDHEGQVTYASQNTTLVLAVEELLGSPLSDRMWPSDQQEQSALFARMHSEDELLSSLPVRYAGDDGVWRWIKTACRRYKD